MVSSFLTIKHASCYELHLTEISLYGFLSHFSLLVLSNFFLKKIFFFRDIPYCYLSLLFLYLVGT